MNIFRSFYKGDEYNIKFEIFQRNVYGQDIIEDTTGDTFALDITTALGTVVHSTTTDTWFVLSSATTAEFPAEKLNVTVTRIISPTRRQVILDGQVTVFQAGVGRPVSNVTHHQQVIINNTTFQVIVPSSLNSESGDGGAPGATAYQVALSNGFVGTEQAWLDSLAGEPGVDGDDGASAYEVAVTNGFVGTEQEWLASLAGGSSSVTFVKLMDLNVGYITPVVTTVHRLTTTIDGEVEVIEAKFRATLPAGALYLSSTELSDIFGVAIDLALEYGSIQWGVVAYHTDVNFDIVNCMVTTSLGSAIPFVKISGRMSNTLSYYACQADITITYYPPDN